VKTDGLESNDGTTWDKSIKSVQQALTMAATQVSGDATACEIWVAFGTYKPTDGTDRTATFLLRDKVGLHGGFHGNESQLGDRAPGWVSTLSGNIGDESDEKDNSYHVVTGATGATLEGFTITGGYADEIESDQWFDFGGGMYNEDASPTVANCVFTENTAYRGGGMAVLGLAPNLINCTFTNNRALMEGGGMANYIGSPTVVGCTFTGNSAQESGGGMLNDDSTTTVVDSAFTDNSGHEGGGIANFGGTPTVTNCTFTSNSSASFGGGVFSTQSPIRVIGCTFAGNSAEYGGGATIMNNAQPIVENSSFLGNSATASGGGLHIENCSPSVTNCTFESNNANSGGGVRDQGVRTSITNCTFAGNGATRYGGGIDFAGNEEWVTNTILWNDKADADAEIRNSEGNLTVSHSIVQGGFSGDSNLAADPLFVSATDLHLRGDSPAIDKGSDACPSGAPATDKDGKGRLDITKVPNAAGMHGVDIGAYEYQGSDTSPGTPVPALCPLPAGHWYLGSPGQSCDDVCATHGECDTVATVGIGSGAGDATSSLFWTCAVVLNHLNVPATPIFGDVETCIGGLGCEYDSANGRTRCAGTATTATASSKTVRRACACVN
jgi:predicted outer membrane repeat protein